MNAQYVHCSIANKHYSGKMLHALLQLLCDYSTPEGWQWYICGHSLGLAMVHLWSLPWVVRMYTISWQPSDCYC